MFSKGKGTYNISTNQTGGATPKILQNLVIVSGDRGRYDIFIYLPNSVDWLVRVYLSRHSSS